MKLRWRRSRKYYQFNLLEDLIASRRNREVIGLMTMRMRRRRMMKVIMKWRKANIN
jgi:hypothetical protein